MNNAEFNSRQHLTYEELVAYHQGYLGNSEMHRLETHLIDCPLCNEALEGLARIEEAELEKRLSRIRQTTGTIPKEGFSKAQWLAVAASVALVVTVSFLFFNRSAPDELLAEKQPAEEKAVTSRPQPPVSPADTLYAEARAGQTLNETDNLAATTAEQAPAAEPVAAPAPADSRTETLAGAGEETTVPAAAEEANASVRMAEALPTEDSVTTELAAAMPAREEVTDTMAPAVATTTTPARVEERVEEEAAAKSKKAVEVTAIPPRPEKGNRAYKRYLKRNLNYPETAKENNIAGEVTLRLTITTDGRIGNIEVVQSLGYGCDQEAIRLVREGPKWLPAMAGNQAVNATVTVTVPFKL